MLRGVVQADVGTRSESAVPNTIRLEGSACVSVRLGVEEREGRVRQNP